MKEEDLVVVEEVGMWSSRTGLRCYAGVFRYTTYLFYPVSNVQNSTVKQERYS